MRRCSFFLSAFLLIVTLTAVNAKADPIRETTDQTAAQVYENVGFSPAVMLPLSSSILLPAPVGLPEQPCKDEITQTDNWVVNDRLILDARLAAGQRLEFVMNPMTARITVEDPAPALNDFCEQAIARAPVWLHKDLRTNISNITGEWAEFFQEMAAEIILNADAPYVDEIAFCVAHISAGDLGSGAFQFDLLSDNAQGLYEADEFLDYARIVDYGEPGEDDYWSTVEYNVRDGVEGDVTQFELDPYYYYWYIVHPRLSDEAPRFINPANGSVQSPPNGVFWRDFFLNHPDDGYPSLREALEGVDVLWSRLRNNGSLDNGAIGAVTTWIRTVLTFDSGNERPNQPARIYRLHMGRCGEHEDMTAAAARSVLIPATGTNCWPNDHVWNEFYDGELWRDWEPVNGMVADSLYYQGWSGGAWRAPALMRWRGDGFVETVTGQYHSNPAYLTVTVQDRTQKPVDGAKVMLASEALGGGLTIATWGFTSSDGTVDFVIGENRNIYMRIDSEVGSLPSTPNQVQQIISQSVGGRQYSWGQSRMTGSMPQLSLRQATEVEDPTQNCRVRFDFTLQTETVHNSVLTGVDFMAGIYPARLDFFICDQENYDRYLSGERFYTFESGEVVEEGSVEFTLPTNDVWHGLFSNEQNVANYDDVSVTATWYVDSEWGVSEANAVSPSIFCLRPNYPNPFNAMTTIEFSLPEAGLVNLSVFDLQGRLTARLISGHLNVGLHRRCFNAEGFDSGVYLIRLEGSGHSAAQRLILTK